MLPACLYVHCRTAVDRLEALSYFVENCACHFIFFDIYRLNLVDECFQPRLILVRCRLYAKRGWKHSSTFWRTGVIFFSVENGVKEKTSRSVEDRIQEGKEGVEFIWGKGFGRMGF